LEPGRAAVELEDGWPAHLVAEEARRDAAQRIALLDDVERRAAALFQPLAGQRHGEHPARPDHAGPVEAGAVGHAAVEVGGQEPLVLLAGAVEALGDPPE
jgi:hypothetical protein